MPTTRLSFLLVFLLGTLLLLVAAFTVAAGAAPSTPVAADDSPGNLPAGDHIWWLNPRPQGNDLLAVSCPTEATCYAVSEASLLHSEDGGQSWSVVPVPDNPFDDNPHSPNAFSDIHCASENYCLAVNYYAPIDEGRNGGPVLRISEGEPSWLSYVEGGLKLVWCADESHCYAVSDVNSYETFFRSADGGATWDKQGDSPPAESIFCAGPDLCWVAGYAYAGGWWLVRPYIHFTDDGGETWTKQYAPDPGNGSYGALTDITCISDSACVAVDANPADDRDTSIVITKDGGTTWTEVAVEPSGSPPPGLRLVDCTPAGICYAAADDAGLEGSIYRSNADWTSWERLDLEITANAATLAWHDISCPNGCLAVGESGLVLTGQDDNWQIRGTAPFGYDNYATIDCPSRDKCVALTENSRLAAHMELAGFSLQGSMTVTLPIEPESVIHETDDVYCPTAQVCYATGRMADQLVVRKSEDGGLTWDIIFNPDAHRFGTAIACPSETMCVVATGTNSGAEDVYITRDGGDTWEADTLGLTRSDQSQDSVGIDCVTTDVCYLVGPGAKIHRTVNGGAGWMELGDMIPFRDGDELIDIACLSEEQCIAVGHYEVDHVTHTNTPFLVTRDGGESWYTLPAISGSARAIDCSDEGLCMAVGTYVYSSRSNGEHWYNHDVTVDPLALRDVVCLAREACFIVGNDGLILGTNLTLPYRALLPIALDEPASGD